MECDSMSVGLFRYDGYFMNRDSKIVFSRNIAAEAFYTKIWGKAISEMNVRLFQDGSEFTPDQVGIVLEELRALMKWCDENLKGNDHFKMHSTLEELIKVIPEEASKSNEPFYIF